MCCFWFLHVLLLAIHYFVGVHEEFISNPEIPFKIKAPQPGMIFPGVLQI